MEPETSENPIRLTAPAESAGSRLDRALAELAPEGLSRSRIAALIRAGAVTIDGRTVSDPAMKVKPGGTYLVALPEPEAPEPLPEAIPLSVIHEDAHLIVVDKPAGMVVHPAPGAWTGTLVNALLHHCGDSLSGIGGVRRPGIVHRIDKDTTGLLVVAKTDVAHHGLSTLFARHDIDREYLALTRGVPDRADPRLMGMPGLSIDGPWFRIETLIARHRADRKKMAVAKGGPGARRAVTRFRVERPLEGGALIRCRLETGRTHQIRVHLAHLGHGLIGDQTYGRAGRAGLPPEAAAFPRQALHAARLGFRHPVNGDLLTFCSDPPPDFRHLVVNILGR
ncbi:RluA family pseudouridine synthase [Pikeienuella piscinae]|uniref:Pseudouridine synthase n=1 Tax=Pikeienuella piscinae TaxID=2748098 RepID=A0A7L5BZQ1_9RHOB|nr:RluA family pseudouridine synthase [Pikeienuella piscinae]QIE56961.1 RluA family pseudouridine synthase [Pikeienuella piscinae]